MSQPASNPLPPARDAAVEVVRTLRDAGHLAYFAGGCVRDELLGREPSDYDVATDAVPDRVRSLFRKTAAVGASFGVILVKQSGHVIEVATFRADGTYTDARRPDSVRFSTPEEDAARRDFTANALFLDPVDSSSPGGGLIDFVGGERDIARRVLRAVGDPDARLAEDHLRALRAVRLSGKLGFTIEPATAEAIKRHASSLTGVSRERVGDEIRAILGAPSRAASIRTLHELGLEPSVLGLEVPSQAPVPSLHRLTNLNPQATSNAALAAWCEDLVSFDELAQIRPLANRVRRSLCLSNAEHEALVAALTRLHFLRNHWRTFEGFAPVAARKRQASSEGFRDAVSVLQAESPAVAEAVLRDVATLESDGVGLSPAPLVTGDDLVSNGMSPGPKFRSVLDRVYDAQLEGLVREKATAMELARRLFV